MRLSDSLGRGVLVFTVLVLTVLSASSFAAPSRGEEPPAKVAATEKRMAFMKSVLGRFSVHVGNRTDEAQASDPLLRWSSPISGKSDGILVVFAFDRGRPAAIGKFFPHSTPGQWVNQFSVVASDNALIMRSGEPFWKPAEYICKFADLADSPTPAEKPAARLSQMRQIAREFSVTDHFGGAEITQHPLRLMPEPIYRYSGAEEILDGALFAFALGTNPECNLLIEAYQDKTAKRYRYAFVPMTIYELQAKYKTEPVWEIERRMVFGPDCRKFYASIYQPEPGEAAPE
jgi:hypothetical protein